MSLSVVQFPHPRKEHHPDLPDGYSWNTTAHGRKFMRSPGRWRSSPDSVQESGDIVFWGEWEAPSRLIKRYPKGDWQMPRFLTEPLWSQPPDLGFLQNTDPYVFGGPFRYSNCRQNTRKNRPKAMQRLDVGSLILFGSLMDHRYVLDTAFVVESKQPMSRDDYEEVAGSDPAFRSVVCEVLYRGDSLEHRNTLYQGATPDNRVKGMFSFFPALPAADARVGFARPAIELPGYINERSRQSERKTDVESIDEAVAAWEAVINQVLDQGLVLGVYAETPAQIEERVLVAERGSC